MSAWTIGLYLTLNMHIEFHDGSSLAPVKINFKTHFLYRPHFLLLSPVAFVTSILARAIACDGVDCIKGRLGLGRPSFGLKCKSGST